MKAEKAEKKKNKGPKRPISAYLYYMQAEREGYKSEVSFQWKNPDFIFKNPDFLFRNPDFRLKNVEFIIKPAPGGQFRAICSLSPSFCHFSYHFCHFSITFSIIFSSQGDQTKAMAELWKEMGDDAKAK